MFGGFLGKSGRRSSDSHDPRSSDVEEVTAPILPLMGIFGDSKQSQASTPASPLPPNATQPDTPLLNQSRDRHLQILSTLEKLIPSTTPGLTIPLPPLLLRIREEDRVRREKATQDASEGGGGSFIDGLPRLPGLSLGAGTPQGRVMAYRLGGDIRAGLGALLGGLDTLEGWIKLQSLETLYCSGTQPSGEEGVEEAESTLCARPQTRNYQFWNDEKDSSIGQYLEELAGVDKGCERVGCRRKDEEHTRWWLHGGKKVGLRVDRIDKREGDEGWVDVWVKCRECGIESSPRALNDAGK
jgi:1-phosphatidylinositol-3-phosphate 5-kinase